MGLTWVAVGEATQSGCLTPSLVSEAGEVAGPTGEGASSRQLEDCHEEDRKDVVDEEEEADVGTVEEDSASKR